MAGTTIGKAYVQILPSAKGMQGQLSSIMKSETAGAGDAAGESVGKSLIGKIKTVVAAAGIGKAISSALMEGADLQQSIGGVETLFKDSADTVKKYASEAYKTAGMSANEYMQTVTGFSASLLQGLGGDTAAAAEVANMALTDMSDNANKMGTSMDLIQNAYQGFAKQNYTMLDNLKLGYGGTKTEMERLLADAQKISGVEYNIDNLSDVYNAIHVIQEDMDITGTTAKEAASTFSGSFAMMKSAAKNLMANLALGEDIKPSLNELKDSLFTFVGDNLLPMVGNIMGSLPEIVEGAMGLVADALHMAGDSAGFFESGIQIVADIISGIVGNIPAVISAGISMCKSLIKAILSADWIGIAQKMIGDIKRNLDSAAVEMLGTDGNIVQSVLDSITNRLPDVLSHGVEIVTNIANGILQSLPQIVLMAGELISQFVGFLMQNLPVIIDAGVQLILNLVNGIVISLPDIVEAVFQVITQFVTTVIQNLPQILESGLKIIAELVAGLIMAIPDVVAAIPKIIQSIKNTFGAFDWKEIGGNIIEGIKNGLLNGISKIVEAAKNVAKSALDAAKEMLGIASPSKEFYSIGRYSVEGFVNAVDDQSNLVRNIMRNMSREALYAADPINASNLTARYGARSVGSDGASAKMDMILAILLRYLPECAKPQPIDGDSIFDSFNRKFGLAVVE